MKYLIIGVIAIIVGLVAWHTLSGTSQTSSDVSASNTSVNTESVQVVTSIYPLAYISERIVGSVGSVTNLGDGRDPHDFRPSAQDIKDMVDADLVVIQGADLEPWGEDMESQLSAQNVPLVIATDNLNLHKAEDGHDTHGDEHDDHNEHRDDHHTDEHADHEEEAHREEGNHDKHAHGLYDPHTWLEPTLMSQVAANIATRLSTIDPNNASVYSANLALLQQDLAALDSEYTDALSTCQLDEIITSHDAFGYVARSYGFDIHTIGGLSTQDTPSAVTLARLKDEAAEGISTILLEENSITAYGEILARETGLQTLSINPIVITIPAGQDYLSIMRSNLETFKIGLSCNE